MKIRLSLQIAVGYFLIVGLAAYFVVNIFSQEIKPGVREAMEDTLVDTANLLAELAADDLKSGHINDGAFAQAVNAYSHRPVDAKIWGVRKQSLDYRVYVTDARGIVVFSTKPEEIGRDYSRWHDVYYTLRGEYGARSSVDDPADANSTVMHVAAPIKEGKQVIGVLTVSKPNVTVQPFIERSQRTVRNWGLLLLGIAAFIGTLFTWHLTRAIGRLRSYALTIADGHKATPPQTRAAELADLTRALEAMREKLEGKHYVESYVHTLTHELKSPLAAIRGAAELLDEESMPAEERQRFLANIREQSERLREIADKMLDLARLEQRQTLQDPAPVDLAALARQLADSAAPRLKTHRLQIHVNACADAIVNGETFLLRQALSNLLDNALDFAPPDTAIEIEIRKNGDTLRLEVRDHGPGIPAYALPQVFDRFFSLPRPASGRKSTGLGLSFVREVAGLHGGVAGIENRPEGGACGWVEVPVA